MSSMRAIILAAIAILVFGIAVPVCSGADTETGNLAYAAPELERRLADEPFTILTAKPSRGLSQEVGLHAQVRFADGAQMDVKIRPAARGASEFNNEPRYELAAYELQKLFLDALDYVVPPTALRMLPRATLLPYAPKVETTFGGADDVLVVLQYWMQNVEGKKDILDPVRFAADPAYARRIGNLNLLTYAIKHGDSNLGNVLVSTLPAAPHAWAVDNGVAFNAPESDRGHAWAGIRATWLPADAFARFETLDETTLTRHLAVLAEWHLTDGRYEAVARGANMSKHRGVRNDDGRIQLGLTHGEIRAVERRIRRLAKSVAKDKIETR
jgi:hypothetical protein